MANSEVSNLSDFTKLCRICRKEDGTLINIFFSDAADVISKIASIQLQEGDCLPENICIPCMDKITEFYQFKQLCEYSDKLFRSILNMNANKSFITSDIYKLKKDYLLSTKNKKRNNMVMISNSTVKSADDQYRERIQNVRSPENKTAEKDEISEMINKTKNEPLIQVENDTLAFESKEDVQYKEEEDDDENDMYKEEEDYGEEVYCIDCQLPFDHLQLKNKHVQTYHPSRDCHYCHICKREFSSVYTTINQLRSHLKYHRLIPKYPCDICDKKFRTNYQRTIHMRLHTGERPATCEICEKSFRDPRYLVIHLKTHTGEKPYICTVCNKAFSHKFSLKVHMKTHSLERSHMCNLCGRTFVYAHNLKIHSRQHTGERPYTCKLCFASFISGSILSAHMLTHSEHKRFSCQECGKKFKRSGDLTIHMRSHTGEKPYACTICCNRYKMSSHLSEHMKTHTGEKNYVCEVCFKSFYNNKALQVHKKTHTGEKSHHCQLCDKSFVHYTSLCAHIRKRHQHVGKES